MSEASTNYRDEQFWFTAAAVGFNVVALDKLCGVAAVLSSAAVSFVAINIVLTRWAAHAGRQPANEPDAKTASARERAKYTVKEFKKAWGSFPYVVAEFSGSLFFLLVILLSFSAVIIKVLL